MLIFKEKMCKNREKLHDTSFRVVTMGLFHGAQWSPTSNDQLDRIDHKKRHFAKFGNHPT